MGTALAKLEDLNEKQQRFIEEYIARGGGRLSATEAVEVVYGYDRRAATSAATRLLKNDKIKAVLADLTISSFAPLAVAANERLIEIITTGEWFGQKVKPSDGLKAIKEVFERGIGPVATKHEIEVHDNRSINEIKASLAEKMAQLGPDEKKMMASLLGNAIDVPFEEVGPNGAGIDPAAPWGRCADGSARQKPGAKPHKRLLGGPLAYTPEAKSDLQKYKERLKIRKMTEMRKQQQPEEQENE